MLLKFTSTISCGVIYCLKYKGCSESNASYFYGFGLWHQRQMLMGWQERLNHSHSMLLLCDSWQQRGTLINDVWHGSVYEAKVCHWIPPCGKIGTHWHSLTLAECLWRSKSGCEHSEVVGGGASVVAIVMWETSYILESHIDFYKHGMQALVHRRLKMYN